MDPLHIVMSILVMFRGGRVDVRGMVKSCHDVEMGAKRAMQCYKHAGAVGLQGLMV